MQEYEANCVETIIVDSGSTDNTLDIAKEFNCKVVHLARESFSFGRSLNVGCEAATGQLLVFISGHCVPVDNLWLKKLVHPFNDVVTAISYGRQVGGPESKFSEHCLFQKYFPPHLQTGQSHYFCNNANSALRKEYWQEQKFDESLTGLEDMLLAKQFTQRNLNVQYVPEAAVYHFHHERWRQVKRRYEREAIALREIMPEIQVHWHDAFRYFCAGVLGDWSRAIQQKVYLRNFLQVIAFRFCQYYGTWRGFHAHRNLSKREKDRYFYPN